MTTFTIGSYTAQWDETFKPGDLITTYNSGYHEFVKYEDRGDKHAPLVFYKQKFKENGQIIKSKVEKSCDAAYCRRANLRLVDKISELQALIKILEAAK